MAAPQTAYGQIDATNGRAGQIRGSAVREVVYLSGGALREVWTMQVGAAADGVTYAWEVVDADGNTTNLSFVSPVGSTLASLATLIALTTNTSGAASLICTAASGGTDTVTFTGAQFNVAFTITESDARLNAPVNTVNAAEAAAIPFGVGVVQLAGVEGDCTVPNTTDVVAQVMRVTPSAAPLNILFTVTIRMRDTGVVFGATIDSGGAPTVATIVTALFNEITANAPANTVVPTDDTTHLTLTAATEGIGFDVTTHVDEDAGATLPVIEITRNGDYAILGLARYTCWGEQGDAQADYQYEGRRPIPILKEGAMDVLLDAGVTIALTDRVYLRHTAAGAEVAGAFRNNQDAGDAFWVQNASWRTTNRTGFDGHNIATLTINLP